MIPTTDNFGFIGNVKNVHTRVNQRLQNYIDKEEKSAIFALYLSFSKMTYIAFCHEALHIPIIVRCIRVPLFKTIYYIFLISKYIPDCRTE